jgi:RNA polymerase sigma-70 factor (ECF subfamily)
LGDPASLYGFPPLTPATGARASLPGSPEAFSAQRLTSIRVAARELGLSFLAALVELRSHSCECFDASVRFGCCAQERVMQDCDPKVYLDLLSPDVFLALRSVARGMLASEDLAMDCVQEALLLLWQQPEPPPDPQGWLVRTVVHKALHIRRASARRSLHEDRASLQREEPCPWCDPALEVEQQDLVQHLERAIDSLSVEMREVLHLRVEHGLEYGDIAAALQVPIGTVRSRLYRARMALAQDCPDFSHPGEPKDAGRE